MDLCGHHFERSAIETYLESNPICPISRQPLTRQQLFPSLLLREVIETYNTEKGLREVHSAALNMDTHLIQYLHSQGVRIMEADPIDQAIS